MKNNKRAQRHKQKFNMYSWGQKNKKVLASIICLMLVLGLLASLMQL